MNHLSLQVPYKLPNLNDALWISPPEGECEEFMEEDLALSGLRPEDLNARTHAKLKLVDHATHGYVIPYFDLDGKLLLKPDGSALMYRTKLKKPPLLKGRKYDQPSSDVLATFNLPGSLPYLHPWLWQIDSEIIAICEGEKKAVSVMKHLGIPAIGIGGCESWRHPDKEVGGIHPWILEAIAKRGFSRVLIIPDGDVWRYDICKSYGTFAHALEGVGLEVEILHVPEGTKIDDMIVAEGREAVEKLSKLRSDELVQNRDALAKEYGLAFEIGAKNIIVQQHTSNVMILLEEHSAFPQIWRNLDTGKVMFGEEEALPDLTEVQIANHFQHHFQFNRVTPKQVLGCMQALATKNQRSPFTEHVMSQTWDGKYRLERWLQECWGVEDSPYVREVGVKFLVSAYARMVNPGCKVDWMMVTTGGQGIGKTTMPDILFAGNVVLLYGENNDKDLHMKLHSALCVVIDELDSFTKRDTTFWKSLITAREDRFRPPYGSSVSVYPRRCVLYGTANLHDFLIYDSSGYRRYAPIEVTRMLEFDKLTHMRSQLWAEARARYDAGCEFWEIENANEVAEEHVATSTYEEMVDNFIADWCKKDSIHYNGTYWKFTMVDMLRYMGLEKHIGQAGLTRELGAVLRAKGADRFKSQGKKYWRIGE